MRRYEDAFNDCEVIDYQFEESSAPKLSWAEQMEEEDRLRAEQSADDSSDDSSDDDSYGVPDEDALTESPVSKDDKADYVVELFDDLEFGNGNHSVRRSKNRPQSPTAEEKHKMKIESLNKKYEKSLNECGDKLKGKLCWVREDAPVVTEEPNNGEFKAPWTVPKKTPPVKSVVVVPDRLPTRYSKERVFDVNVGYKGYSDINIRQMKNDNSRDYQRGFQRDTYRDGGRDSKKSPSKRKRTSGGGKKWADNRIRAEPERAAEPLKAPPKARQHSERAAEPLKAPPKLFENRKGVMADMKLPAPPKSLYRDEEEMVTNKLLAPPSRHERDGFAARDSGEDYGTFAARFDAKEEKWQVQTRRKTKNNLLKEERRSEEKKTSFSTPSASRENLHKKRSTSKSAVNKSGGDVADEPSRKTPRKEEAAADYAVRQSSNRGGIIVVKSPSDRSSARSKFDRRRRILCSKSFTQSCDNEDCPYVHDFDTLKKNLTDCKRKDKCELVKFDGEVYSDVGVKRCYNTHPNETIDMYVDRITPQRFRDY